MGILARPQMRYPNKLKNATSALIKETAQRLELTTDELLTLHAWASTEADGAPSFCAWCLSLEACPGSIPPFGNKKLMRMVADTLEPRYALVYQMILHFKVKDVSLFWERDKLEDVHYYVCAECGKPMRNTTSGYVCENGHGGSEIEAEDSSLSSAEMFGCEPTKQIIRYGDRPTIPWNEDQSKAFKNIFDWYKKKDRPVYRMFGFAGTGKTSMIQEVAYTIQNGERGIKKGEVLFAAYTGKAAAIMLSKGCAGAQTIHSLIYKAKIDSVTGKLIGFVRNEESPLKFASLLVCDEMSQLNDEMGMDLLRFGVPILVVGDPGQLEPIEGEGFFLRARPDTLLTKIERSARENPLIWIATKIRKKILPPPGAYGDSRIFAPGTKMSDEVVIAADQILCGTNRTRTTFNRRFRMLSGHYDQDTQFPVKGDRLMCLKNNKLTGVLNGTQWHCSEPSIKPIMRLKDVKKPLLGFERTNIEGLHFRIRALDLFDSEGNPLIINTICSTHHFDQNLPEPPWRDIAGTDSYTFAYASTVHKAQGSQWDYTACVDESMYFPKQEWKHLYTQWTRAASHADLYLGDR